MEACRQNRVAANYLVSDLTDHQFLLLKLKAFIVDGRVPKWADKILIRRSPRASRLKGASSDIRVAATRMSKDGVLRRLSFAVGY